MRAQLLAPEGRGRHCCLGAPQAHAGHRGADVIAVSELPYKGIHAPPPQVCVVREEGRAHLRAEGLHTPGATMALLLEGPMVLPCPDAHPHLLVP